MLCNALYGKLLESSTNRMEAVFVTDENKALRCNTDPRHRGHLIFSPEMSISFRAKKKVKLNQSWAVGFTVLEVYKF